MFLGWVSAGRHGHSLFSGVGLYICLESLTPYHYPFIIRRFFTTLTVSETFLYLCLISTMSNLQLVCLVITCVRAIY